MIKKGFYKRKSTIVAQDLLGKYLVRKYRNKILKGRIVEVESYIGAEDKASHAYSPEKPSLEKIEKFFGKVSNEFLNNFLKKGGKVTPRNKTIYLEGGFVYIYLCYGLHWQFNIVTGKAGEPECVLIRALETEESNGPGKLCKNLKLNKSFNGERLIGNERIWVEEGDREDFSIVRTKRIGIDYAEEWAEKPLRFLLRN